MHDINSRYESHPKGRGSNALSSSEANGTINSPLNSSHSNATVFQNPLSDNLTFMFYNVKSFEKQEHEIITLVDKFDIDTLILLECMNKPLTNI